MDYDTLESLKAALSAAPDNQALLEVVLRGQKELGDFRGALELIRERLPGLSFERVEGEVLAADLCLAAGAPETGLELLRSETPYADLQRARIYLELGRQEDGRSAYRRAVSANPTLEDKELESNLSARTTGDARDRSGKVTKLRVLANDDTDRTEMTRILAPDEEPVTFDDVGGLEEIKKQINKRIILPFLKPSLFQKFKKRVGGGILLFGPPGCGKTLLARATAGECRATFYNVVISDILDMYIGESERKLHAIFENARANPPSVLFFDEIEAIGGKRQYTREATASKLVSQFLSEMDGFANRNTGVLVLGATNVPWAVDSAFRRPGRFDRVLFVPPPDREARGRILQIHLEGRPTSDGIDYDSLARRTSTFSGADMLGLVETASDLAIEASLDSGRETPITGEMLRAALDEVKPTTLDWLTTARNYARYANESGQYDDVLNFLKRYGKS